MTGPSRPDDPPSAEDVVRGFLQDVRSGRCLGRAERYLAPQVRAHQGRPGDVRGVVLRSPDQYAEHVRAMLRAHGPWDFEVTGVARSSDLVEATWRQVGVVGAGPDRERAVVEQGRASYLVRAGRITEYWIEFSQEIGERPGGAAPPAGPARGPTTEEET